MLKKINKNNDRSTQKTAISLPIPGKVLQILINYLYTDDAPDLKDCEDDDLASMTLVIADQFFCGRLKELSEVCLCNLLSLRNAAEMLQIAFTYNADDLKTACMEFICLNLTAVLESRSLEIVQDSVLQELTKFYRDWLPCMSRRHITAYCNAPDDDLVDLIYKTERVSLETIEEETPSKSALKTPKKKTKEKKSKESSRVRNTSTGSFTSEDEPEPSTLNNVYENVVKEEVWIKVVNQASLKLQKHAQLKVRTPVDAVKLMSQPIPQEKFVNVNKALTEDKSNVIKLVPQSILREKVVSPNKAVIQEEKIPQRLEKEFLLRSDSEKDFPALNASPPDRSHTSHSTHPRQGQVEVYNKIVKISQKQRKRMAAQSISEDEEAPKTESTVVSPWAVVKNESQLLAEIMKQESRANALGQSSPLASSPPWQDTSRPGSSLSAVMASERRQRELFERMKSKPLEYTQMEDKAIEDLLLLYNANDVTDERITVRRADYEFVPPPVWVSSRK